MTLLHRATALLALASFAAQGMAQTIETADIDRFWTAYDNLRKATTRADSVRTLQRDYIDPGSEGFKRFIEKRNFTAAEYVALIGRHPAFWQTVRPPTERIALRKPEIEAVLNRMAEVLPGFERPNVCFAIGCLRTGGTVSGNYILVGSEIAASDSTVDATGLGPWLQSVIGRSGDVVAMVAHEAVHTRQKGIPMGDFFRLMAHKKLSLLNMSIVEGSCDFITQELLGLNINAFVHRYGVANDCSVRADFQKAIREQPFNYTNWLYNGGQMQPDAPPADLGYYMGYVISKAYYDGAKNKEKALKTLMKRGKYKKVYRKSGFAKKNCP